MEKNAYHYHPTTGEYLGTSNADPSPLEPGEYLYPAHSTPLAPPADIPAGKVARYQAGACELVDDLRGTKYWTADGVEHTQEALGALPVGVTLAAPLPPPPSIEQQLAALQQAVQEHLDNTAIAKGYDSILSAGSYAGAPNAFQAESVAFITWRGAVWEACYAMLAAFQAGQTAVPTKAELIAALPPFAG